MKKIIIIIILLLIPSSVFGYKNIRVNIYGIKTFSCVGLETTNLNEDILGLSFISKIPKKICMVFHTTHHHFTGTGMKNMNTDVGIIVIKHNRIIQDFIGKVPIPNQPEIIYNFTQRSTTFIEVNRNIIQEYNLIPGDIVKIGKNSN